MESKTFLTLLSALEKSNDNLDLIIYDNSPVQNQQNLDYTSKHLNVIYMHDELNPGVSKAYNIAASIGESKNKKWIFLFDQDTDLPNDIFMEYNLAIINFPSQKLFAPLMVTSKNTIISPCKFKFNKGFVSRNKNTGLRSLDGYSLINSGICVRLDVFKDIGGYDERFKLDYSDHDFITRYKKKIDGKIVVIKSEVLHGLSSNEKQSVQTDIKRFINFNDGVIKYAKTYGGTINSFFVILGRCIRLCLMHKTFVFVKKTFIK